MTRRLNNAHADYATVYLYHRDGGATTAQLASAWLILRRACFLAQFGSARWH